jgi:flagellar assembly factor FliW
VIKLQAWGIFYKKILFVSLAISFAVLIASMGIGVSSYSTLVFSFAVISPFAHLYLYEIDKPNEYYFFANLGLHKPFLWFCTLSISALKILLT